MQGLSEFKKFRIGRADVVEDLKKDPFTQRIINDFGIESDQYRICVLGHHGVDDTDAFIPEYVIESVLHRPFVMSNPPLYMGVDVASSGGADFSTIVLRSNNVIIDIYRQKLSEPDFRREVVNWIECRHPCVVAIDEVGVGMGLAEFLQQEYYGTRIEIIGVNGGKPVKNQNRFGNMRTLLGWEMRNWLTHFGFIAGDTPHLQTLLQELRSLRASIEANGLYTLESKTKLSKSPDIVDALSYSFAAGRKEGRERPIIGRKTKKVLY